MKKFQSLKLWAVVASLAVVFAASSAFAAEAVQKDSFGSFLRKLFKYPVKTTENVAQTAGHGVENTGGVLQATGRNIGSTISGEHEKVNMAEPFEKTGAGAKQFVEEVGGSAPRAVEEVNAEEAQIQAQAAETVQAAAPAVQ